MAESHGGKVEVEAAPGGGAQFRLSLLEAECGFDEIAAYLVNWALFEDWCDRNGRLAPDA